MKKNILVFPCGSEIGLELKRALKHSIHFELFGASTMHDHGEYVFENYIHGVPFVDSDNFIDYINKIVDEYKIDLIFPAHDSVVLKLAQNRHKLHCDVITSDANVCEIARSKKKTYETLDGVIPVPKMYDTDNIPCYPVFLKPDVGQGSKGCLIAKNENDVSNAIAKDPSLLILEYLPGAEYTIDCFSDYNGNLLYAQGRQRARILNGISVRSMPVDKPEFADYAKKIAAKIPFNGAWFFQVKERANGELALLEIAPRIAGTMALSRLRGVNLPILSCFNALKMPVSIQKNQYDLEIDRALENKFKLTIEYDAVYTDFDDCLIINGKVNTSLVAFLYQARNNNKKIILITKHKNESIDVALERYRLNQIFDEVIHLTDEDEKYMYITSEKSIFIDDSFAERKRVADNLGIPVFAPDMIDELV